MFAKSAFQKIGIMRRVCRLFACLSGYFLRSIVIIIYAAIAGVLPIFDVCCWVTTTVSLSCGSRWCFSPRHPCNLTIVPMCLLHYMCKKIPARNTRRVVSVHEFSLNPVRCIIVPSTVALWNLIDRSVLRDAEICSQVSSETLFTSLYCLIFIY